MQKLSILNSKEKKKIFKILVDHYGFNGELDYAFFLSPKKKIYILSKEFANFDESSLRIDTLGLYFGELKETAIRLSIEGTQIVGPNCDKNIVEIAPEDLKKWMFGQELSIKNENNKKGFFIVKCGKDYLGAGSFKGDVLKNYVAKSRRIGTMD